MQTKCFDLGRVTVLALMTLLLAVGSVQAEALSIQKNDDIIILGNSFAERMHLFGYFETFLHSRFPELHLRVRNMGWSADEIDMMIRPRGFPKLFDELEEHGTDLIFLCFGMNESFGGAARVDRYRDALGEFVEKLQGHQFNGRSTPRIVLVSPIAHETVIGDRSTPIEHNQNLRLYTEAMAQVARQHKAVYVDLFSPTLKWIADHDDKKLTINGIHLSEYGDWVVSQMIARNLGLIDQVAAPAESGGVVAETFRRCIYEKNYQYFHWWHPANASYIHGRRKTTQGSKHLASEREQLRRLIEDYDQKIWAMSKPKPWDVWRREPVDGQPIWFPTPSDRRIPGVDQEAQLSVESDGDGNPHIRSPAEQLTLFEVSDGYQVNLFASELRFPIANPMAIQFDALGRLWVANTPTWPHSLPGKQPHDSVVILEDTDRDGVADKHSVFLDKMNLIHGFTLGNGGAYVAQTPYLVLARDTDGDDRADWLRVVLQGFGAEDAEHSMNNFCWGPDGSIFFSQGVFFHTQVEAPYGPVRVRDSAVFRYRPYDHNFEVYVSHHLSNPYGNLFGKWGRGILLDASRGQYYPMDVLSANFLYPKHKKRTDQLAFSPHGSIAAGCDWLYSRHFPAEVQGRFLVNHCEGDVGTHWYTLSPEETLYHAKQHKPWLLTSTDKTFRPVAMAIGPDGALYIADFYSHIFENVNFSKRHPGRDHSHGRIWRITHTNRPLLTAPRIVGRPIPELLDLLKAHEDTTREFARRELQQRGGEAVIPHLDKWVDALAALEPEYHHHLTEALWVRQSLNAIDVDLLLRLLSAKDPGARIAATQVLRFWQDRIDDSIGLLAKQINDSDPRVRIQAVLACGFSNSEQAIETALGAAEHNMDPGLEHALDMTIDYFERMEQRKSGADAPAVSPPPREPQIFFTSPRIVTYQLRRLSNQQLVLLDRDTNDPKYVPVYEALLSRPGLEPQYRKEAIEGLSTINESDRLAELIAGIRRLDQVDDGDISVLHELALQLTTAPPRELIQKRTTLVQVATDAQRALTRRAGYAAMVVAESAWDHVWATAVREDDALVDLIGALPMIADARLRQAIYPSIKSLIQHASNHDVRNAAIEGICHIPGHDVQRFALMAELIQNDQGREAAIVAIRRMGKTAWPVDQIVPLFDRLVAYAKSVPVSQRDTGIFLEAMALGYDLVEKLPEARAIRGRKALRNMAVSVFLIKPIYHQMLYDRTRIVVEAGKRVSVVFNNDDIMPHNLVITKPGALEQVGMAAEVMAALPDARAKGYIPDSRDVLWATQLLQPGQNEKLSFDAPQSPGVYPYVCTYPGHWRRMFGAMYVVADLDEYHADPETYLAKLPILDEPLNDNRPRTLWKLEQLVPSLKQLAHGRSFDQAKELFKVASCAACHRLNGVGHEFGPDLTKLDPKLGARDILEEILDPSKKVNEKFITYTFALKSGRIVTGLVVEETASVVKVIENPLATSELIEIEQVEIEERKKSTVSIMPTGLLDKLTREEILDLIAYVISRGDHNSKLFQGGHRH